MRYGNCANILTADDASLRQMKAVGFDFIEANLTAIAQASDTAFGNALEAVQAIGLPVPVCNCMFPADVRIAGGSQDPDQVAAYVDAAFARAQRLGVDTVVLGSDKARNLPEGYPVEQGYVDLIAILKACITPACERYGITIVIEPLRRPCNFINTLADGMRVVNAVRHPQVQLLADSIHVMTSGEDMDDILRYNAFLRHVHVSDWNRALPEFTYSTELTRFLDAVKASGHDGRISFEASAGRDRDGLQRALLLLKQKMH